MNKELRAFIEQQHSTCKTCENRCPFFIVTSYIDEVSIDMFWYSLEHGKLPLEVDKTLEAISSADLIDNYN